MTPDQKTETLRKMLTDFLEENPYMFDFGGEITDPETQYRSRMKPSVVVKTTQCQFVENITWAVGIDDETGEPHTFEDMMEALNEDISYGSYHCEDGANQVTHWPDYFDTEAEALAWFEDWKVSDHGKNEIRRLAGLRAIKEAVA
jgi:hypothetical protein